jgi:hypothetical protein
LSPYGLELSAIVTEHLFIYFWPSNWSPLVLASQCQSDKLFDHVIKAIALRGLAGHLIARAVIFRWRIRGATSLGSGGCWCLVIIWILVSKSDPSFEG